MYFLEVKEVKQTNERNEQNNKTSHANGSQTVVRVSDTALNTDLKDHSQSLKRIFVHRIKICSIFNYF